MEPRRVLNRERRNQSCVSGRLTRQWQNGLEAKQSTARSGFVSQLSFQLVTLGKSRSPPRLRFLVLSAGLTIALRELNEVTLKAL